jgi:hypothetical protein
MKNLFLFFLVFSILSTLPACKKIQEKRNPKVSGRVLDYNTRQPLADAKVLIGVIRDADYYSALDSVTTDENGYYEITSEPKFGKDYDFENDNFIVSAKKQGYEITYANKAFDGFQEFFINVGGSVNTEYKNLYLRKEGTLVISGSDIEPFENHNQDPNKIFLTLTKVGNDNKVLVKYPPYHKILNPTNSWQSFQIDTYYSRQIVVPIGTYYLDISIWNTENSSIYPSQLKEIPVNPQSFLLPIKLNY